MIKAFIITTCILLGILIVIFMLAFYGIHWITTENGTHTGYITAVETNGIIFKTVSVYVKSDVSSSQEDIYCLIDKSLIDILKQKEESKEKVTVYYYDYFVTSIKECSKGSGIIYKIK